MKVELLKNIFQLSLFTFQLIKMLISIKSVSKKQWSDFVYNHPDGNIFHTPEMYQVYEETPLYTPIVLFTSDKACNLTGCLCAVIHRQYKDFLGKLTARSIVTGGPIALNNDCGIIEELLKEYNRLISPLAIYSQFRNISDMSFCRPVFTKCGYTYEEHLNILVDLTKSEEQLWKDIHTKRRNEIRKAEKAGLVVREFSTKEDIESAYSILQEVYSRAKLPLMNKKLLENAVRILSPGSTNMIRLMGAYKENKLIGVMILLAYKGILYDWYAGSFASCNHFCPNDILPWKTFLQMKKEGYTLFDFGGAGNPGVPYGVRDYKLKFGGEVVNFGRYESIHKPFFMSIGKTGLKIYQKLRS